MWITYNRFNHWFIDSENSPAMAVHSKTSSQIWFRTSSCPAHLGFSTSSLKRDGKIVASKDIVSNHWAMETNLLATVPTWTKYSKFHLGPRATYKSERNHTFQSFLFASSSCLIHIMLYVPSAINTMGSHVRSLCSPNLPIIPAIFVMTKITHFCWLDDHFGCSNPEYSLMLFAKTGKILLVCSQVPNLCRSSPNLSNACCQNPTFVVEIPSFLA